MPTKVIKKFTAWSYSRYKDYVKCPLYAKLKHVDKLPEPGSAALTRGSDIHTLAERYVRGDIKKLPQELSAFKEEFKDLRNVGRDSMMLEDQRAFDINWRLVEWYSPLAWVRVIYDVHYLKDGFRYVVATRRAESAMKIWSSWISTEQPRPASRRTSRKSTSRRRYGISMKARNARVHTTGRKRNSSRRSGRVRSSR